MCLIFHWEEKRRALRKKLRKCQPTTLLSYGRSWESNPGQQWWKAKRLNPSSYTSCECECNTNFDALNSAKHSLQKQLCNIKIHIRRKYEPELRSTRENILQYNIFGIIGVHYPISIWRRPEMKMVAQYVVFFYFVFALCSPLL